MENYSNKIIEAGNYKIFFGNESLLEINKLITAQYKESKIFILLDENTYKHCLPILLKKVELLKHADLIEIESGEENKNIEVCIQLWKTLSESRADRHSLFINLGGGVITDLGGFLASTFKRGIDFIHIPTTLLAQVDASIGGKTGIDLLSLKNEIGTFSTPEAIFIYPPFLNTLNNRQVLSGFAEIIKHALIADVKLWNELQLVKISHKPNWTDIIGKSLEIKNKIVLEDPKEKGIRKALNFGHTIGHAIESYSLSHQKTPLLHGEAIALGIICEAFLSKEKCNLSENQLEMISSFIFSTYKHIKFTADSTSLIDLMRHDKKNKGGNINFTLLNDIGRAEINVACDVELICQALNYYQNFSNKKNK